MGNIFSSPSRRQRRGRNSALTDQPWRETKGWTKKVRNDLKKDVADRVPKTQGELEVPFFNVALTGQIGAGKSSFFNSLNSIFQEEVVGARAEVGRAANSLTKEYCMYEINPNHEEKPLSWRICDTMGLQPGKRYDATNILQAVDGHVPHGFEFSNDPEKEIDINTPDYIPSPELKDRAHCVAVVVNGKDLPHMENDMIEKLKALRKDLIKRKIPTYILLTHIDEACEEVNKDLTKVFRSIAIRDLVNQVGTTLDGLPENQIFPIMNYKTQVHLQNDMDILLLYALRQMLSNAQEYLANQKKLGNRLDKKDITSRGLPVAHPTP